MGKDRHMCLHFLEERFHLRIPKATYIPIDVDKIGLLNELHSICMVNQYEWTNWLASKKEGEMETSILEGWEGAKVKMREWIEQGIHHMSCEDAERTITVTHMKEWKRREWRRINQWKDDLFMSKKEEGINGEEEYWPETTA